MLKLRTIVWQFYRPLFAINLVYSFFLIYRQDMINFMESVFLKLLGYALLILYQYYTKSKTYYYFRNAGYNVTPLYLFTFGADLVLFSLLYTLIIPVLYVHP